MEGKCESCGCRDWRYKCPGCQLRTCSLECVKKHKSELGCRGERLKTAFVSIPDFTTSHLLSDYYFLEETGRVVDSAHRGWVALGRRQRDARDRRQTLQRVQSLARKRGISLRLLPQGMGRHVMNTSRTVWNRDRRQWTIEWRVKLVFPEAEQEYHEERVGEDVLLGDLLKKYIHSSESDPVIRHRLRCYVREDVSVFMETEKTSEKATSYCQLQLQSSLAQSLRDHVVLEFPELFVVLPSNVGKYSRAGRGEPVTSLTRLAESYGSEEVEEEEEKETGTRTMNKL